jgi:hypothetical protein
MNFEAFQLDLEQVVPWSDGTKNSRPVFDHVRMFKVLLQAVPGLSDERSEYRSMTSWTGQAAISWACADLRS